MIFTPVVIEIDGPPIINRFETEIPSDGRIVVAAYGGKVGDDQYVTNDPAQTFREDEHVLLGLTNHPYLNGDVERRYATPLGVAWNVGTKYTVTEDGIAVPPYPGATELPVTELIKNLSASEFNK